MSEQMLFYTAVPVLLGSPHAAGRLAADLYSRHGVSSHWFGHGWHPYLSIYAKRHSLTLPFVPAHDRVLVRLLYAFAKEQRPMGGIPCLIPCSTDAEAFLARVGEELDEQYVILERPAKGGDPLYGLVHSH